MRDQDIQDIREFNRFYTNIIGLLDQHLLSSEFTLPEARVLYELYHLQPCTASALMNQLTIDKGYLSRILAQFTKRGLLQKKASKEDGRSTLLSLTASGNQKFEKINLASIQQVRNMVRPLTADDKARLLQNMKSIRDILTVAQHDTK